MASYPAEVLADSPVLYLGLEETSGATCANTGSLGSNATANGTFTRNVSTGMAGLSVGVTLGGTASDYISHPDNAALDLTGDFTYECWIKTASFATSQYLMSKGKEDASNAGYGMWITTAAGIRIDRTQIGVIAGPFGTVSANTWTHVVVTRATNLFTIYLQGSSVGSSTVAQAIQATSRTFTAGAVNDSGTISFPLVGQIDEVAVYNTALSATRVAAHYAARNTAPGSTFNGSSAVSLTDTVTTAGKLTAKGASAVSETATVTTAAKVTHHGAVSVTATVTIATAGGVSSALHGTVAVALQVTIVTRGKPEFSPPAAGQIVFAKDGAIDQTDSGAVLVES